MVRQLQDVEDAVDKKLNAATVKLFTAGHAMQGTADGGTDVHEGDRDDGGSADIHSDSAQDDDGSDWSSDSEDEGPEGEQPPRIDTRNRRRAVFDDGLHFLATTVNPTENEDQADVVSDDGVADEDENTAPWRMNMLAKQSQLFSVRAVDIKRVVYGEKAVLMTSDNPEAYNDIVSVRDISNAVDHSDESDDEDFFKLKRPGSGNTAGVISLDDSADPGQPGINEVDSIYAWRHAPQDAVSRWTHADGPIESLRVRVVTGGQDAFDDSRKRSAAEGQGDYGSNDGSGEEFGDFEDIETGQLFTGASKNEHVCVYDDHFSHSGFHHHFLCTGSKDQVTQAAVTAIREAAEVEKQEELRARKLAKKAAFDSAYDHGGSAQAVDGRAPDGSDEDIGPHDHEGDGQQKRKGRGWAR